MNTYIDKKTPIVEAVYYNGANQKEIKSLFESRIISGGYIIRQDDNKLFIHLPLGREFYLAEGEYLTWEHGDFYCHCLDYTRDEYEEIELCD
jgi:hypothetical protein